MFDLDQIKLFKKEQVLYNSRSFVLRSNRMASNENFKDSASKRHLFLALLALVSMPLLPMLMGWYTYLA